MKSLLALVLLAPVCCAANPELLAQVWKARWISVPETSPFDYGVYHFRRSFDMPAKPAAFVIHVTADNRYQLFVNGDRAGSGPARGDLYHWRYETFDIARYLKPGRNVLAAVVWNFAEHAPEAQITYQTGLLVRGDGAAEDVVNTGPGWKGVRDEAYSPRPISRDKMPFYFAVGATERVNGSRYPWGWEQPEFDDSGWKPVRIGPAGAPRNARDAPSRWMLVPRSIPAMEHSPLRLARVRRSNGAAVPAGFPAQAAAFEIPAHRQATLLLDQNYLTTAYPELTVSGGRGARIQLGYAEALWVPGTEEKGNRNEVGGKEFLGYADEFIPDGGAHRLYRPLWWRTYRYLQVSIETAGEPLTVEDLRGVYTGYPFERRSRFEGGPPELQQFLEVGWRTARLCAHETYMDCPYYEQLQYAGDTRVQALVSLYTSGDARLARNAIEQLDSSRTAEGATYSRAPSRLQQYIPPFSLWWIGMVHDYWMYHGDESFVRGMLPGVRAVLGFFAARQKANGSLGPLPWWNFVDWTRQWKNGVPPSGADGSSAPVDLQLLLAYDWAADLEETLGSKALSAECRRSASQLRATVRQLYWDPARKLFADDALKHEYSQHANALAILARVIEGQEATGLINRVVDDASLVQCSIYFRFYLSSALNLVGAGDRYLDLLGPWRTMLSRGLTTWAEEEDPTRSDCHAWGSSPNYELFRTVLGIDSAAPGFRRVAIRPFLGKLPRASGAIPHPSGEIAVSLDRSSGKLRALINLPAGITGEFLWQGARRDLLPGSNRLEF